jgi:hypothetical protein
MPLLKLLRGLAGLLSALYTPEAYFGRAFRSIGSWNPRPTHNRQSCLRPTICEFYFHRCDARGSAPVTDLHSGGFCSSSFGTGSVSQRSCGLAKWCCSLRITFLTTRRPPLRSLKNTAESSKRRRLAIDKMSHTACAI